MDREKFKNYIGYAINGYTTTLSKWIEISIEQFDKHDFILKSASYDINRSKLGRKSIKLFLEEFNNSQNDNYNLTLFSGTKQNVPTSWNYGVNYDTINKQLILFFDQTIGIKEIYLFFQEYIKEILKDTIVHSGYLFLQERSYDYPLGGLRSMNKYNEDSFKWWPVFKPQNLEIFLGTKNILRHIYESNILNEFHLEIVVENVKLPEWIEKNNLGILEKIGKKNWLWSVPENKLITASKGLIKEKLLVGVKEDSALDLE